MHGSQREVVARYWMMAVGLGLLAYGVVRWWGPGWMGVSLFGFLAAAVCFALGAVTFRDWRLDEDAWRGERARHVAKLTPENFRAQVRMAEMRRLELVLGLVARLPLKKLEKVPLVEHLLVEVQHGRDRVLMRYLDRERKVYLHVDLVQVFANCFTDGHDRWRLPGQNGLPDNAYRRAVADVTRRLVRAGLAERGGENQPAFLRVPPGEAAVRFGVRVEEIDRAIKYVQEMKGDWMRPVEVLE